MVFSPLIENGEGQKSVRLRIGSEKFHEIGIVLFRFIGFALQLRRDKLSFEDVFLRVFVEYFDAFPRFRFRDTQRIVRKSLDALHRSHAENHDEKNHGGNKQNRENSLFHRTQNFVLHPFTPSFFRPDFRRPPRLEKPSKPFFFPFGNPAFTYLSALFFSLAPFS